MKNQTLKRKNRILCFLVTVCAAAVLLAGCKENQQNGDVTEELLQTTAATYAPTVTEGVPDSAITSPLNETTQATEPADTTAPTESESATKPESSSKPSTGSQGNTPTYKPGNTQGVPSGSNTVTPAPTENPYIDLPYTIEGYDLVIQRVAEYDGIYLEDGSNEEVTDVAMMLLVNTGKEAIEYADITLTYGDTAVNFVASAIPAGGRAVVQATDRKKMPSGRITGCNAGIAVLDTLEMSAAEISVVDNGSNTLTVTNLTGADIPTVRVFYKYYMEDDAAYVGGITYTAKIDDLAAGSAVNITPSHYVSGSSKVVMVRTYEAEN